MRVSSALLIASAALAALVSMVSAVPTLHFTKDAQELFLQGTNPYHYGDPATGCMIDEVAIRVQGVRGGICTAHCSPTGGCPADKPPGANAVERCALENRATGEKFCTLLCSAGMKCGEGASCKVIQGNLGICTYDDVKATNLRTIEN